MRGKIGREAVDAAFLRLAAGDPENVGIDGQRPRRGVGIGGLGIIDEDGLADTADIFHAMGEARESWRWRPRWRALSFTNGLAAA